MKDRQPSSVLHRRFAVETPEHVRLDYVLADVGSRAAALALDFVIIFVTLVVVGMVAAGIGGLANILADWFARPMFYVLIFLAQWGYFLLFEALWGGRTPGKRVLGLRVVHAGGEPLTFHGSALRNLIRVIDLQPAVSGMAGAVCILVNKRAQRLGDLVAGTVVVQDSGGSELLGAGELPPGRVGRPVLSVEQFELLAGYMARREGLASGIRRRVAQSLRGALAATIEEDPKHWTRTADENLVRLYEEEAPRHAARRGGASLQAAAMAREQREAWAEYVRLVEKGRKRGLPKLTEEEVRAFGQLYRGVTADLARARTYGASPGLLGTVRRWAGSGHNLLYRSSGRVAVSVGHWIWAEFPRAVRRFHRQVLLAALMLFGPMGATYLGVQDRPVLARVLAGGAVAGAEAIDENDPEASYQGEVPLSRLPTFSAAVMTNNIQVAFMTFAGGLLAGLGTLLILVFNGISIGAAIGAYGSEGVPLVIMAFVFPHGFIELAAICVAGGAGLGLGSAILMPGRRTRAAALRERGRAFLTLLAGSVLMLVVAGLIEGYYSPLEQLPNAAKFVFGAVTGVLLVLYFGFAGRSRATGAPAP
ncbi:MAG: hypothetical protein F4087_03115 [Gemmatimonadetes bacterium]|nr:stage II sporulation protein M [Gemmatimonadota bacterium]MXX36176.1 hypothetical protein [Gemmatimonadota bacterium]MYA10636.1 hypothetical protein [Gemmatimonadota bacterium]MYD14453.1 hypothetical protein [Gemmatimonadota bacterium]MYE70111.1 hypothetical protein [Gemmatimonadota bacterium]